MSKQGELFATADAARVLKVTRQRVAQLVSTGQLSLFARTPGGQMLFEPEVVHQLQRRRGAQRWIFRRERAWRDAAGHLTMAKAKIERLSIDNRRSEFSKAKGHVA
jgi:hypothetical protein